MGRPRSIAAEEASGAKDCDKNEGDACGFVMSPAASKGRFKLLSLRLRFLRFRCRAQGRGSLLA